MASIRKEFHLSSPPESIWPKFRDIGAVHKTLAPGFVTDCRMDGPDRIVTFANGLTAREVIVTLDDEARRLAYSARSDRLQHHHASFEILDDGPNRCRVIWTADVLPHDVAKSIGAMMDAGVAAMKSTLDPTNR